MDKCLISLTSITSHFRSVLHWIVFDLFFLLRDSENDLYRGRNRHNVECFFLRRCTIFRQAKRPAFFRYSVNFTSDVFYVAYYRKYVKLFDSASIFFIQIMSLGLLQWVLMVFPWLIRLRILQVCQLDFTESRYVLRNQMLICL